MSTVEIPRPRGDGTEIGEEVEIATEAPPLTHAALKEARDHKVCVSGIAAELDEGLWVKFEGRVEPYTAQKDLLRNGEHQAVVLTGSRLLLHDTIPEHTGAEWQFVVAKFDIADEDGAELEKDWRAAFFSHAATRSLYEGEPYILHPRLRQGVAFRVHFSLDEGGYYLKARPYRDLGAEVPGHGTDYITGEGFEIPTGPAVFRRLEDVLSRAEPVELS